MTRAKPPRLDPVLAALSVDPEVLRWAFSVPFESALVGRKLLTSADVRPGTSRDRKKALTTLVLLLAQQGAVTEDVVGLLAGALGLKPRDLDKRGPGVEVSIVTPAVFAHYKDHESRLGDEESLALRIIAHVAAHGATKAARLAVLDLLRAQQDRLVGALTVNALAAVAGLVDARTGAVIARLPGHDPRLLSDDARYAAETLVDEADEQYAGLAEAVGYERLRQLAGDDDVPTPARKTDWVNLARRAGLTFGDLLALTGFSAARPSRPLLKASGLKKQTTWDLRNDPRYEAVENAALKHLGEGERTEEQFRAMQDDAFAATNGDPEAKARLRAMYRR